MADDAAHHSSTSGDRDRRPERATTPTNTRLRGRFNGRPGWLKAIVGMVVIVPILTLWGGAHGWWQYLWVWLVVAAFSALLYLGVLDRVRPRRTP